MERRKRMNRGKPPARVTPLKRVNDFRCCDKATFATEAAAEAALQRIRQTRVGERAAPQRVYECANGRFHLTSRTDRGEWQAMVRLVMTRDGFRCLRCGSPRDLDPHHRRLKSHGGPDSPENLATLCRICHSWAHAHPTDAIAKGLIIPAGEVPAKTPVVHVALGRVFLTPDGRVLPLLREGGAA
jgi:hypothetical protein